MLRIDANYLKEEIDDELNEIYYYNGELYNGIAYDVDTNWDSAENIFYKEGKFCNDYINEYFKPPAELLHTLTEQLERDPESYSGEPITLHGTPFTGIAYSFEEEFCVREFYYHNGWLISEIHYNKSGKITLINISFKDFIYKYVWNQEGDLSEFYIKDATFCLKLEYDETMRVKDLTLIGNYFKKIKMIKDIVKFPLIEDETFFKNVTVAESLSINGDSITDHIFDLLSDNNGMCDLKEVNDWGTSLTNSSIEKLKKINSHIKYTNHRQRIKELGENSDNK